MAFTTPQQGRLRALLESDPAAGAEISIQVPAERRWRLVAMAFSLVTDATAGDRTPTVRILDENDNIILESDAAAAHAASTTRRYYVAGWGYAAASPKLVLPLPLILPPQAKIVTLTGGILAGDNYSAPLLLVEDWDNNRITGL